MSAYEYPREWGRMPNGTWIPDEIAEQLIEYVKRAHPYPILKEFTTNIGLPFKYIYELEKKSEKLASATRLCIEKKEVLVERGMNGGTIPTAGAIFTLKQLGWTDKQELSHTGITPPPQCLQVEIVKNVGDGK